MDQDKAETLALQALGAVLSDHKTLNAFLAVSGLDPSSLRGHVSEPSFLGGLLDFLSTHETHLISVCTVTGMDPEQIIQARRLLPGAPMDGP